MATTNEKIITPVEFAKIMEQLSIYSIYEIDHEDIKNAVKKRNGSYSKLDTHADTQNKIKQFIVLDLLKKNNEDDLQKSFDFYVKTLQTCINQNDFQSASTIIDALRSPPILRLRKEEFIIKNESVEIKSKENAFLKTNKNQKNILSKAELLFNPNNDYQQYRNKSQSLQNMQQHLVPALGIISDRYVDLALVPKKNPHSNTIYKSLEYGKKCAEGRIDRNIQTHSLYKLISDNVLMNEKEFDDLTDKRSNDILPNRKNAQGFKNTESFENLIQKEKNTPTLSHEFKFTLKKTEPNKKSKTNDFHKSPSSQKIVSIKKRYSLIDKIDSLENRVFLSEILAKKVQYFKNSTQLKKIKEEKHQIDGPISFAKNKIKKYQQRVFQASINNPHKITKQTHDAQISKFAPIVLSMLSEATRKNIYISPSNKMALHVVINVIENTLKQNMSFNDKKKQLESFLADGILFVVGFNITELEAYNDLTLLAKTMLESQASPSLKQFFIDPNTSIKANRVREAPLDQTSNNTRKNNLLFKLPAEFKQKNKKSENQKIAQEETKTSPKKNKP